MAPPTKRERIARVILWDALAVVAAYFLLKVLLPDALNALMVWENIVYRVDDTWTGPSGNVYDMDAETPEDVDTVTNVWPADKLDTTY